MVDIYSLISRAQKLREETRLDSVSPDRVGTLLEDTLKYINEYQLLASSPSLHKIYASVSAMQSDPAPKSDLTGKALKLGQLVVIVPANQTDATAGDVYRYDGPSGNTSAWTFVAKIGGVPADAELNASSTNPVQNKVVTEKLTELSEEVNGNANHTIKVEKGIGISPSKRHPITLKAGNVKATFVDTDNVISVSYVTLYFYNKEGVLVKQMGISEVVTPFVLDSDVVEYGLYIPDNQVVASGEFNLIFGGNGVKLPIREELSENFNYETKVTDITAAFEAEKTMFYQWSAGATIWIENNDFYWRLYKVEAGKTIVLRKLVERGTIMAVECDLADFVVGGKLGNLVIEENAPLGDYTYNNTSGEPKYIAILYRYYSNIYFEIFKSETISIADKVRELEDAAKPISSERIADGAVTIEKTNFVEVRPGAQLFDKDSMAIGGAWYYWDPNFNTDIGGYANLEVNNYTGELTAIKIPMAKISNVVVSQPDGVIYSYYAVDSDMKVLGFDTPNIFITTGLAITIPEGCAFLLISARYYNAESFMVNEGNAALPYEKYSMDTYVNGIKLTEKNEEEKRDKIYLPDTLYAVVGDTLQVFYRGLMSVVNPYAYDVLISCNKGKQYPRYFEYTPTTADIGETTFSIIIKNDEGAFIEAKSCKLITKAAPSSTPKKNIACFGDSLTVDGTWCAEAFRRLTATDGSPAGLGLSNIQFVGKKNKKGAGYFGEGGWRWQHYVTAGEKAYRFEISKVNTLSIGSKYTNNGSTFTIQEINVTNGSGNILCLVSGSNAPLASGTLTLSQGGGDSSISYSSYEIAPTNPLWDATSNKMSFIPYANEYADGQLDVVYVLLGWNDVHRESYPYPNMMANCKTFIDTLHAEFPNAKMKLMGLQVCSINGGMGANYGAGDDYSDTYGTIRRLMKLNLAYKELAESAEYSSFVEYVDVASQFDSEYNMPYAETKVNTRSSLTERRGTNGVHPSNDGYMQIADVVYRNIIANL